MHILEEELDKLSDEIIITLIQSKELDGMDYMLNRYKSLVRKKAKDFYLIGGDRDDLIQEGMIGLYKSIRDYDSEKESSFYSFAELCISRQIYTAIRSSNRKKNIPLNTYISLSTPQNSSSINSEDKFTELDGKYTRSNLNPEELLIDRERTSMLEYELIRHLSNFEKEVLILFLQDMNYIQIAERLSKESKSIDNALQRIRNKLNKVLKDYS